MHNPDYVPPTTSVSNEINATFAGAHLPLPIAAPTPVFQPRPVQVRFSEKQLPPKQRNLAQIFAEKTAAKEFFYGIELTARSYGPRQTTLDYDSFGTLLPLFTSLVWIGAEYANVANVMDVESINLGNQLRQRVVVMPHFTCYRAHTKRLDAFLELNFTNLLALRGDEIDSKQAFLYAKELVEYARAKRGDTISIGVAGYPEGHPESKTIEEDMMHLKEKVNAGADFIITQICFSPESIIRFVRKCRDNGINVPIIVGVTTPNNMRILKFIKNVAKVMIPDEQLIKYKELENDPKAFNAYAVENAVQSVQTILASDVNIYGFQFFTLNRLENAQQVVQNIFAINSSCTSSTNLNNS
ncbi:5,10-methylenetetrahydrofolate reductase [Eurosta solidaginis]|uniref:5,10-methylenetetrahydrofolate reductase n=1 Tax=Eurosta solidaginis TaxID=178769 RepID=UPI003530AEA8